MKKKYSLDYDIELDTDRMEAVRDILDKLDTIPSHADLEQLASYVLYGKDKNGLNSIQRGETDDRDTRRYKTYKKADEKVKSLDEILDDPLTHQSDLMPMHEKYVYTKKKRAVKRPKYNKITGEMIDPGDSDIPGMIELWETIDRLEHTMAANKGELPFNDNDTIITESYRLWQFSHMLADLRRHQYYLLEYYKPTLHFSSISITSSPSFNFDSDTFYWIPRAKWQEKVDASFRPEISKNINDYEVRVNEQTGEEEVKWIVRRQAFDWENPWHVRQLINHYSAIYMQNYDKLDSWGRTLIYDFDRYCDRLKLTPLREFILTRRIDKATNAQIAREVHEKFGIKYREDTIVNIITREIPQKIADLAMRDRLLKETPPRDCKVCSRCKRLLPATPLFYVRNATKLMGVESACKECQRKRRIERGGQSKHDSRTKDTTMYQMPAGETNS